MSLYPLEIPGKTSLPGNSAKFCDTPWQFQGHQKRRSMVHTEIPWHEFFLNNTPGNSTCTSLTNPLHTHTHTCARACAHTHTHTHTLYFQYPWLEIPCPQPANPHVWIFTGIANLHQKTCMKMKIKSLKVKFG